MTIKIGDVKLEVREWAPGKALLMTRDEGLKKEITDMMEYAPDAIEMLTEPDCVYSPEDAEGLMLAVADRERIGLVMDFDDMKVRLGYYEGENGIRTQE